MIPIPDACIKPGSSILPFTITNLGYTDFVQNFAERLKDIKMFEKFVVVCTDAASFKTLEKNKYIHCAYYPSKITENLVEWKTNQYKEVVFNKLDITRAMLKSAQKKNIASVLYIDTDIWIYRNFEEELQKVAATFLPKFDFIMQDGENYTEQKIAPKSISLSKGKVILNGVDKAKKPRRDCSRLCTGFMLIKPSNRTIDALDYKKIKEVDWKKCVGNQPYLNEVIKKKKLKAIVLDRNLVPNGSLFLKGNTFQPKDPWALHYTYMLGEEKIQKMQEEDHWIFNANANANKDARTPNMHTGPGGSGAPTIFVPSHKPDVYVRCPDGFGNQLRLALAGSFLVQANHIKSYTQEWVINNHNNVDYNEFFIPLPKVNFTKVKPAKHVIETVSFQTMIERYAKGCSWGVAFQIISRYLLPTNNVLKLADAYAEENQLGEALGLHVRRTCKDALLKLQPHRSLPLTNEELLPLCQNYPKVFLATDNAETQRWFHDHLKDKLAIVRKIDSGAEKTEGKYDPKKVVRHTDGLHTVLDFLALKSCGAFHGSNESSFSLLLYHLRNSPYDFHVFGKF
jgi:hypothetical protein